MRRLLERVPSCIFFVPLVSVTDLHETFIFLIFVLGVLDKIKDYYGISNGQAGALQTAFICSYMVFAPIFGYLGDRYNRKIIMAVGIFLWSITTLAGSFIPSDVSIIV